MSLQGQLLRTLSSGKLIGGDFVSTTVSPQGMLNHNDNGAYNANALIGTGKWVYCMGEDGTLYIFDGQSGQLENILEISAVASSTTPVAGGEVIGISHHPSRNLVASIADDGTLKTWKP